MSENKEKEKKKSDWYKLSKRKNFQVLALGMMSLTIELMLYIVTLYMARGVGENSMFYAARDYLLVASTIGFVFLILYIIAIIAYLFNKTQEYHDTIIGLEKELEILKKKP